MKRKWLALFLIWISICSYSQINQPVEFYCLSFTTGYRPPSGQLTSMQTASSILIVSKGEYYLVSNYHIMAGRNSWDTTQTDDKLGLVPNLALVQFYKKNKQIVRSLVPLLDESGKRLFFSPKASNDNITFDIAIIKLNRKDIPVEAELYAIDIDKCDTTISISPYSKLIVYGFKGNESFDMIKPGIDTVSSINHTFVFNTDYIYAYRPFSLSGSSGGPIFHIKNGKNYLVGMVSTSIKKEWAAFELLKRGILIDRQDSEVSIFLSLKTIKDGFDSFFKSK